MDENEKRKGTLPLILVLEPTRELVIQVAQELGSVCTAHRIRVEAIYGGSSFFSQGSFTYFDFNGSYVQIIFKI
jgi:superfamily II DNA/RNA helicase